MLEEALFGRQKTIISLLLACSRLDSFFRSLNHESPLVVLYSMKDHWDPLSLPEILK